jgi:hypothetical protein
MTITIKGADGSGDYEMESAKKKKKKNRREVDKEFFIPYQPPDFKRERGYEDIQLNLIFSMNLLIFSLEIQSFERQTNEAVMDLTNDDGTRIRGPTIQKTKWFIN